MAYSSKSVSATTTLTAFYTVPAGMTVMVTGLFAVNTGASNSAVTIVWRDSSNGNLDARIVSGVIVPPTVTLQTFPEGTKLFLNEGDVILVQGTNPVDITLSYAEL